MPRITRTDGGAPVATNGHEPVQLDEYLAALDSTTEPRQPREPQEPTLDELDEAEETVWDKRYAKMQAQVAALAAKLDEVIPAKLLKKKKGFGTEQGKLLTFVPWYVVVARLNEFFGHNNWDVAVHSIQTYGGEGDTPPRFVSAIVQLTVTWPDGDTSTFTNTGSQVTAGKSWSSFEMAYKGAVSDGITRCAKMLGDAFGLTLYNDDTETPESYAPYEGEPASATTTNAVRRPAPKPSYPVAVVEDDEDEEQEVAQCESCGKDIKGYTNQKTGKVYTTADLVAMSKRQANGRVLCYDCRNR